MNIRSLSISVVFLLLIPYTTFASTKDYAIEVILFVNKDGLQQTAEQFSINHIIPVATGDIHLDSVGNESAWQAIPEDEYILNNVAEKLTRSGRYRILEHIAWRQPVVERDDAVAITINAGRDFTSLFPERAYKQIEFSDTSTQVDNETNHLVRELAGTITVVITRYIHVYSDLVYRLPRANPLHTEDVLNRDQVLVDYAVNSHRRMRSRELHYIDHPLVGILVEATPIEEEN